jgi:hypothetical protein
MAQVCHQRGGHVATLQILSVVALSRLAAFLGTLAPMSKQIRVRRIAILFGLIIAIHAQAFGQIHYVQCASSVSSQTASAVSASFASGTTAANAIIVGVAAGGPAITAVADSRAIPTRKRTGIWAVQKYSNLAIRKCSDRTQPCCNAEGQATNPEKAGWASVSFVITICRADC